MLKINKVTITQLLQIRTMNMIQLDMKRDMDIQMSNTLINTLDNHLCWRQWHLKNGRAIPRHITIMTRGDPITGITMARTFTSNKTVRLHGLSLPELSPTQTIQQLQAQVMQLKC